LFCLLSPAAASLDRPKPFNLPHKLRPQLASALPLDATDVPPPSEARLTAETVVVLDGRKCQFNEVPATALVARIVLAEDGKTIVRIEFQTRK